MAHKTFQPRIAIIGGGPAGLCLGRLLHQQGLSPEIFDLRSRPSDEELSLPSGMLDMHEESGQKALKECGLWEAFEATSGECSESMRVFSSTGELLHSDEGQLSARPEYARNRLVHLLIQSVPADMVCWNCKIFGLERGKNEQTGAVEITVNFGPEGRRKQTFDFVVGADGAWSKVRKLVSHVSPFYSGAQFVTATVTDVSDRYPHLAQLSGTGSMCALGGGNAIMTQKGSQDSIRMYACVRTQEENWAAAAGVHGKTAAEVKQTLLDDEDLFKQWAPPLKDLLSTVCEEETRVNPGQPVDIKPMYMIPVGHSWEYQTGTTIIGDAAHLMTPWAGEGVNLALWDSLDLAHALAGVPEAGDAVTWQNMLEPRVRQFEAEMISRSKDKAQETWDNKELFRSDDGDKQMQRFFQEAFGGGAGGGDGDDESGGAAADGA